MWALCRANAPIHHCGVPHLRPRLRFWKDCLKMPLPSLCPEASAPGRALFFCRFPPPYGAQLSLPPHQRADPYSDVSQSGVSLPLSGLTVLLAPWACVPASPFTISRRRSSQIPVILFPAAFVQVPGYAVFKVRLSRFLLPLTYKSREGVKYKGQSKFSLVFFWLLATAAKLPAENPLAAAHIPRC